MSNEVEITYLTPQGNFTEIPPDLSIQITPLDPLDMVVPGRTAFHEAAHTVAAILTGDEPELASRRPGPGYLGITILRRFNKLAFVAAHALGCDGTGHDLSVLHQLGHDVGSLVSAAKSLFSGKLHLVNAVASLIESQGTITGAQAKSEMDRADNPEYRVTVRRGDKIRQFVTRIRFGQVAIPAT